MLPGNARLGGVVSRTVTLNPAGVDVLPAASFAVHETFVVPSANVDPDDGTQVTGSVPSTRSVAVAVNVAVAPAGPVASSVRFAGTVTVGAVVSTTCTTKVVATA